MNTTVILDWKFVTALGATTAVIILAVKLTPVGAQDVLNRMVDTRVAQPISLTSGG